jgi:hypothetical protein
MKGSLMKFSLSLRNTHGDGRVKFHESLKLSKFFKMNYLNNFAVVDTIDGDGPLKIK